MNLCIANCNTFRLFFKFVTNTSPPPQAKDSLAACSAELAAARNASSSRPDPALSAAWAAMRNASAGAPDNATGPGNPARSAAGRNASNLSGGDASNTPEQPSGLAALAAGAAASAAQTVQEGANLAGEALQDARQAAAGAAAKARDGAVGAAAGDDSLRFALLTHVLKSSASECTLCVFSVVAEHRVLDGPSNVSHC